MAKIQVAAVFSDNMVLQREKIINIFGWVNCSDNDDQEFFISVELFNSKGELIGENKRVFKGPFDPSTSSGRRGLRDHKQLKWVISLPAQKGQDGCSLKINMNNQDTITYSNIVIGEVWLAGGQSNMEFELHNCTEGPKELADTTGETGAKNVRFYYTNKIAWMDNHFYEAERNTSWQTWESEGKKAWSAVGFFFAKKLAQDLGCTVGIIGCNWGGTSASAWMRREYLEKDEELCTYLTEQAEATKDKSIEQQCREYDEYEIINAAWQKKCDALYAAKPDITWAQVEQQLGKSPWPGPRSCKNPYRPTGLYDCMVNRVLPYTLKGVIWYQGESDDHKPHCYAKLFSNLIDNWRTDWKDPALPFVFVQLPCHRNEYDKDFKHWCLIRQEQEKVHHMIKNAFMTCALDLGQFNDIHPKAKKTVGERLEQNALANVYNEACGKKPEEVLSPMLASAIVMGAQSDEGTAAHGRIVLTFENAPQGFVAYEDKINFDYYKRMEQHQGNSVPAIFTGFEVAGADGEFYPAAYRFGQNIGEPINTITVYSPLVPNPVAARYAWYNYGPVNIYGKNGLPLAPFMTFV
ncbi:MAG: hypothetical protein J6X78_03255 [Treponema sp.]|nr:hypothetical protein [Treponema sp.]